jgi:transposase
MQVRAYARFVLQRAKNDRIDAALIAECAAHARKIHPAPDPRLAPLAEHLTMIEQLAEDCACCKTRREQCREAHIRAYWQAEIARLKAEFAILLAAIRRYPDRAATLDLIASIDGIGLPTAATILLRLPEIGGVSREIASALAGLAPYDDDSGAQLGMRRIAGGRKRLRKRLYSAALAAAFHGNAPLKALYQRLRAAGKPHKVALIACARKLVIYANTVVARGAPWRSQDTTAAAADQEQAQRQPDTTGPVENGRPAMPRSARQCRPHGEHRARRAGCVKAEAARSAVARSASLDAA